MNDFSIPLAIWFARTLTVGGILLTIGWLVARRLNPSATRELASWCIRGALMAAVLCTIPAWIAWPLPRWIVAAETKLFMEPKRPPRPFSPSEALGPNLVADVFQDNGQWHLMKVHVDVMVENENGLPPQSVVQEAPREAKADREPDTHDFGLGDSSPAISPASSTVTVYVLRIVLIAYGIGVAIGLIQLILSQLAVWRMVLQSQPAPGLVRERFAAACDRAGVTARLLLSSRVASPVCFGLVRSIVVLPKTFAQTAYETELNWVFAHELAHLARGDHRLVWWVGIARALFFPVPAFWSIRRQLGLAQEYLADAAAAAVSGAAAYAEFLVTLSTGPGATRTVKHPFTATGVKAGRSDLYRRVTMLVTNEPTTTQKPSRGLKILAAGGTLGAVILLSGFGISAEPSRPVDAVIVSAPTVAAAKPSDVNDDQKAAEAKAKADALRAKAEAAQKEAQELMRAAENARVEAEKAAIESKRQRSVQTIRVEVDQKEIEKIKQQIADAAKNGDVEGARKAADKLARIAEKNGRTFTLSNGEPLKDGEAPRVVGGKMIVPPAPGVPTPPQPVLRPQVDEGAAVPPTAPPRVARAWSPTIDEAKQTLERGMKQFKESLERVKDNPEARAEIEKAMKAFENAMNDAIEKMPKAMQGFQAMPGAEWKLGQPMPKMEFNFAPWGMQQFQLQGGFPGFGNNVAGGEGRLGVIIESVPAELVEKHGLTKGVGVYVIDVKDGSPAAKAGIKKEDIILEFAGKPVPGEAADAVKLVGQVKKDEKVTIVVMRKGEKKEIKDVTLPEPKSTKVRVLEALPENFGQFQGLDAEQLQKELARVQEEIKRLHGEGLKLGGGRMEGAKSRSLSVSVNNDDVSIQADEDGVKFDIKARKGEGVLSIKVRDGDKTVEAESIKELPEKYRKTVESFLKSVKIDKE